MKARASFGIAALWLVLLPVVSAASDETSTFRRWGVGWDDGPAARYFVKPNWGLGLSVSPFVDNGRSTELSDSQYEGQPPNSRDYHRRSEDVEWSFGSLAFADFDVSGRFKIGPYARFGYSYISVTNEETYVTAAESGDVTQASFERSTDVSNVWTGGVGLRPSLGIGRRFLLEARFGIDVTYRNLVRDREGESRSEVPPVHVDLEHSKARFHTWQVRAVGQDRPVYATIQLMLLL